LMLMDFAMLRSRDLAVLMDPVGKFKLITSQQLQGFFFYAGDSFPSVAVALKRTKTLKVIQTILFDFAGIPQFCSYKVVTTPAH